MINLKKHGNLLKFIGFLLLICFMLLAYLQLPMFGKAPSGSRLARIQKSPNYANGEFRNNIDTPLHTNGSSELTIWKDILFGKKIETRPPFKLPVMKTDLKSLDIRQDIIVWLGHSSFYVQSGGKRILIDPVLSRNAAPLPFFNEAFDGTSIYQVSDLPEIDVLLITHDHYDHLDYPTVRDIRLKVKDAVVGLGVGADLKLWGYDADKIHEADWYNSVYLPGNLRINVTPARHFSGRTFSFNKTLWVGFVVKSSTQNLFFSGDTGYGPHFKKIASLYGPFDWVTLDSGQYDPRWANVHMNPEQSAKAAEVLSTRVFTPEHIGKFSLAPHTWNDPFDRAVRAGTNKHYVLFTPQIGQPFSVTHPEQLTERYWWKN